MFQAPRFLLSSRPLLHWWQVTLVVLSCYAATCSSISTALALAAAAPPRTVLVTGGAGYIGSHTCVELLNAPYNNYRVVVVDNLDNSSQESLKRVRALTRCDPERLAFRQCDLRDRDSLRKGRRMKLNV